MDNFFYFADHFGVPVAVMVTLGAAFWVIANNVGAFLAPLIEREFESRLDTNARLAEAVDGTRSDHVDMTHLIREARDAAQRGANASEKILEALGELGDA